MASPIMASPILNFVSISGPDISADYQNLPDDTQVVLVNKTSGVTMPSPVTPASGSGTLAIALPAGFPLGDYYLKAQDSAGGWLAQSVEFYVS
jgi:hypothetical protein